MCRKFWRRNVSVSRRWHQPVKQRLDIRPRRGQLSGQMIRVGAVTGREHKLPCRRGKRLWPLGAAADDKAKRVMQVSEQTACGGKLFGILRRQPSGIPQPAQDGGGRFACAGIIEQIRMNKPHPLDQKIDLANPARALA